MRTLYSVPIIHIPAEFGSLRGAVTAMTTRVKGEAQTQEFFDAIAEYWRLVEKRIFQSELASEEITPRTHIFIDSLPDLDPATLKRIIGERVDMGIPCYTIARALEHKGAHIHGTEDMRLLLQDQLYWYAVIHGGVPDISKEQSLLDDRDHAIARRINSCIPDEEYGLLFIGRFHDVEKKLHLIDPMMRFLNL